MEISHKRYQEIKHIANYYFDYFKTRNPLEIFQKLDISYSLIDIDGNIKGFTHINEKGKPWVYLNNKYDQYSLKIIAAHELGHIALHSSITLNMFEEHGVSSKTEYEANIFLMEFMPQTQPHGKNYMTLTPTKLKNYICNKIH